MGTHMGFPLSRIGVREMSLGLNMYFVYGLLTFSGRSEVPFGMKMRERLLFREEIAKDFARGST